MSLITMGLCYTVADLLVTCLHYLEREAVQTTAKLDFGPQISSLYHLYICPSYNI